MSTIKKVTKKEKYLMLAAVVEAAKNAGLTIEGPVSMDELIDFTSTEIDQLNSKAASAQKRAAARKAEGDELREHVFEVLDAENLMTIDQIVSAIGQPNVSRNMVVSRLNQLIELDRAEKDSVSVGGEGGTKSRKIVAYRKKA